MKRKGGRTPVDQPVPEPEPEPVAEEMPGPNPEVLIEQLTMILEEAEDKENVKRSIKARLNAAAQMADSAPANMSSMDADIDDTIEPYEGDADLLGEVADRMEAQLQEGAGRKKRKARKTRKVTKKSKKSRKYSRRR